MSKAQRMSAEDKQNTLIALFQASNDVFNKEELEREGSRLGVKTDTIMDNVKVLVDDRKVQTDKIGSGNFYWSFRSAEYMKLKNVSLAAERQAAADEVAVVALERKLAELQGRSTDGAAVAAAQAEIAALERDVAGLAKEAAALANCDPAVFNAVKDAAKVCKEGADRWTDNVFAARSWVANKFPGRTQAELDSMMKIPAGFDYVE